jgi:hypothetical protein
MNNAQLIQWILMPIVSFIVAFLTTYFFNRHKKDLDFDYNYRKIILHKREQAYVEVERVLRWFESTRILPEMAIHAINMQLHEVNDRVYKCNTELSKIVKDDVWTSGELYERISALENSMGEIIFYMAEGEKVDKDGMVVRSSNCMHAYADLLEVYFNDVTNLDKIEKFKKEKVHQIKSRAMIKSIDEFYRRYGQNNG